MAQTGGRRREDRRHPGRGRDRQGRHGPGRAGGRRAAPGECHRGTDNPGRQRGGGHRGAGGDGRRCPSRGAPTCSTAWRGERAAGTGPRGRERGAGSGTLRRDAGRRYPSEGLPAGETDRERGWGRPKAGNRDGAGGSGYQARPRNGEARRAGGGSSDCRSAHPAAGGTAPRSPLPGDRLGRAGIR